MYNTSALCFCFFAKGSFFFFFFFSNVIIKWCIICYTIWVKNFQAWNVLRSLRIAHIFVDIWIGMNKFIIILALCKLWSFTGEFKCIIKWISKHSFLKKKISLDKPSGVDPAQSKTIWLDAALYSSNIRTTRAQALVTPKKLSWATLFVRAWLVLHHYSSAQVAENMFVGIWQLSFFRGLRRAGERRGDVTWGSLVLAEVYGDSTRVRGGQGRVIAGDC